MPPKKKTATKKTAVKKAAVKKSVKKAAKKAAKKAVKVTVSIPVKAQVSREEIERKYYPERYDFWPFGDPFINKRKREATKRRQQGQRQWYDED